MSNSIYSCVLADQPKFAVQSLVWAWSLIDLAGISPARLIVHAIPGSCVETVHSLRATGVQVREVEPFHERHPYCNKLVQLQTRELLDAEYCILCDSDIAFVKSVETLLLPSSVRAKIVDLPNPPQEVWSSILAAAALPQWPTVTTSFGGSRTPFYNCNGGIYMIPRMHFKTLQDAWPRWALWLIDRIELIPEKYQKHVDQISFGLTLYEQKVSLEHLSLAENYPTHASVNPKPDISPKVIHYHGNVDPSHLLKPVGVSRVDKQIALINRMIRKRRRIAFDNQAFWNFRYAEFPDLGSGIGSRGESLATKRELLNRLNRTLRPSEVLDIGCGDLEIVRDIEFSSYTGMDISSSALRAARGKRPDWGFVDGNPMTTQVDRHDLVLCLDVLIHQPTYADYIALVARLLSLSRNFIVVSGYNQAPWHCSEITFFYEPLSKTMQRLAPGAQLEIAGGYRDTTVLVVKNDKPDDYRQSLYETEFGSMWSRAGDMSSDNFEIYQAHFRNELVMLLHFVGPGDVVLDIGAHIGTFSIPIAKKVGPEGGLICVEPEPRQFSHLAQNIALHGLQRSIVLEQALVGQTGRSQYVGRSPNAGAAYFSPASGGKDIDTLTLDDLCHKKKPKLIKIDVQGLELDVLKSGEWLFSSDQPILYIYISADELERENSSFGYLENWLFEKDYCLFKNKAVSSSSDGSFSIIRLRSLREGGRFFGCLAVPRKLLPELQAVGKVPDGIGIH